MLFVENLKNSRSDNSKNKNKENFGFSLIELSIVLIIIGLLVAGVTGGASLIQSAKTRAFINEINNYRQAVNTFYAANGRFPGDINNTGKFGLNSGYTYSKTDFKPPYDTGDFVPNVRSAPWIELYTDGITDFKPLGNGTPAGLKYKEDMGQPPSNVFQKLFYGFSYDANLNDSNSFKYRNSPVTVLYYNTHLSRETDGIAAKTAKDIDKKMDDGVYNTGIMRSECYGTSSFGNNTYEDAIENNRKCNGAHFDLFIR